MYNCQYNSISIYLPSTPCKHYAKKQKQLNYTADQSFYHYTKTIDLLWRVQRKRIELTPSALVVQYCQNEEQQIRTLKNTNYDEPRLQIHEAKQFLVYSALRLRYIDETEIKIQYEKGKNEEESYQIYNFTFSFSFFDHIMQSKLLFVLDLQKDIFVYVILFCLRRRLRYVKVGLLQNFLPNIGFVGVIGEFTNQWPVYFYVLQVQGLATEGTSSAFADGQYAIGAHLMLSGTDNQRNSRGFVKVHIADIAYKFAM